MKHALLVAMAIGLLSPVAGAAPTHLDIMVPDLKDTDLLGPVKSVKFDLCQNVSGEHTTEMREYDRTGNLLKVTEWNAEGEQVETTTFHYDDNGCYERMHYENSDTELEQDWQVILSPKTRQIALREQDEGLIALETYSEEGYLESYQLLDENKKPLRANQYKRDEHNRQTRFTRLEEGKPAYTYYFKRDDSGVIDMERQRYHQEKEEFLHTYEYLVTDDNGNWTQRILVRYHLDHGKKDKVYEHTVVRKIEYYENETEPKTGNGEGHD